MVGRSRREALPSPFTGKGIEQKSSVADPGCFSRSWVPDPTFFHPEYEFKYFNPKKWFLSSRKYDPGCSSRIPITDPDPDFLPIPDPGVKRAPYPGSGSATLQKWIEDLVRCCFPDPRENLFCHTARRKTEGEEWEEGKGAMSKWQEKSLGRLYYSCSHKTTGRQNTFHL